MMMFRRAVPANGFAQRPALPGTVTRLAVATFESAAPSFALKVNEPTGPTESPLWV